MANVKLSGTGVLALAGVGVVLFLALKGKDNLGKLNPNNPDNIINSTVDNVIDNIAGEDTSLGSELFDAVQSIKRFFGFRVIDITEPTLMGSNGKVKFLTDILRGQCAKHPTREGLICRDTDDITVTYFVDKTLLEPNRSF